MPPRRLKGLRHLARQPELSDAAGLSGKICFDRPFVIVVGAYSQIQLKQLAAVWGVQGLVPVWSNGVTR